MMISRLTIHPDWDGDQRTLDAIPNADGTLTVRIAEGSAEFVIYGTPEAVLQVCHDMHAAARAAQLLCAANAADAEHAELLRDLAMADPF